MELAKRSCAPCAGGIPPLEASKAKGLAVGVPDWTLSIEPPRLTREFRFKDFAKAMVFVNRVAELAEAEGHHPDVHIHWNRVGLELWTHDVGGLSENDFILAAKIDRLAPAKP
jgi:4a-hydroxytetrahydrobiopterin dehydratase